MLSVTALGAQGHAYYSEENYYTKTDGAEAPSEWFGKGAEALGLKGSVSGETFDHLLAGQLPGGEQLGRMVNGELKHRPGYDLTFSAPKSVSILIEAFGDKAVLQAYERSIRFALDHIQQNALQTRKFDAASGKQVRSGGQTMVAALFRHDISRNGDAQTHTHAVLLNMVRGKEEKWRSIESLSLYKNKKQFGAIFRSHLAHELQNLGYGIDRRGPEGLFEIKDFPKELIAQLSTRSQDIAEHLKDIAHPTSYEKDRAAIVTRPAKQIVERAALRASWRRAAEKFDLPEPSALRQMPYNEVNVIEAATEQLTERTSVFSEADLLKKAMQLSVGRVHPDKVLGQLSAAKISRKIYTASQNYKGLMTTPGAVAREQRLVEHMLNGQGVSLPLVSLERLETELIETKLSSEQKAAVHHLLAKGDRIVGLQGIAGSGKTTTLREVGRLAKKTGVSVLGLAPSSVAAAALRDAGITTETLQLFLTKAGGHAARKNLSNTVIILDESSMVSSEQMEHLLSLVNDSKVPRLMLVGDVKQLDAVGAGAPFDVLQRRGLSLAVMETTHRQSDGIMRAAVQHAFEGKISRAFAVLNDQMTEVPREAFGAETAQTWLSLPQDKREGTHIIAQTHKVRAEITGHLRDGLKAEGQIAEHCITHTRHISRNLTRSERRDVENYESGQMILFRRSDKSAGIAANTYAEILERDLSGGFLKLATSKGTINWSPSGPSAAHTELFHPVQIELANGDKVRWTRNDPAKRFLNSDVSELVAIDDKQMTFRTEFGETFSVSRAEHAGRHLDYGWTSTVHGVQGKTMEGIIAVMDANNDTMTTQKSFYVAISRMKDRLTIITDNADQLKNTFEENTGEKIAALDVIDAPDIQETKSEMIADLVPREQKTDTAERPSEPEKEREPERVRQIEHGRSR